MKVIWMKVTTDEYELPVAVAGSVYELANLLHVSESYIKSAWCNYKKGKRQTCPFRRVEVEE